MGGGLGGGPTGLRTSKQALRQAQGDRAEVSAFLWDGQRLLAEIAGGSTVAQYTAGLGAYGPMLSQRRSGTSSFYHPSVQGTVETLTDASGTVTDTYTLTAFGVPVATTGSTTNPHRYIGALGYYTDPTTGLDYVRARYLRPTTGSWLSVDPVASEPRYQYVGGRATWAVDANGLRRIDPQLGVGSPWGDGPLANTAPVRWVDQPVAEDPPWMVGIKAVPGAFREVFWGDPASKWEPGESVWKLGPGEGWSACFFRCAVVGLPSQSIDDIAAVAVPWIAGKVPWVRACLAKVPEAVAHVGQCVKPYVGVAGLYVLDLFVWRCSIDCTRSDVVR